MFKRLMFAAGVLVAATSCSSSSSTTPTPTGTVIAIVSGASTMTTTAYNPNPITVSKGTTLSWVNNDSVTHTSTGDANAWSSGNIAPGGSFNLTVNTTGTFTYHCLIHPGMVGTVNVQ
jgi:plastocyanin